MNIQDYILPLFYKPMWHLSKLFAGPKWVGFYCADPLDYIMFQPIKKHLHIPVAYIAKNSKTRNFFNEMRIPYKRFPAYPDVVIMARQTAYKFPVKKIIKIGFDHGLYQFKRWTSSKYYNLFDVYFVSSENQVKLAKERGINTTVAIGYPKSDQAFDGTYDQERLERIKNDLGLDPDAGVGQGWHRYVGRDAVLVTMERFGASAPYKVLAEKFGFTPQAVVQKILGS